MTVDRELKGSRAGVVAAIGTTQTIAWASSYYMPAILGAPIAAALRMPQSAFFGLFLGALLLSAVVGPSVGRLIHRHGGRPVLAASNLILGAGSLILAAAHGFVGLATAWTVLGIGSRGSLRLGLRGVDLALWPRGPQRDNRDHADRRVCQHDRLAVERIAAARMRLARCLLGLGRPELPPRLPLNWLAVPGTGSSAPPSLATIELPTAEPPRATMPILAFFFLRRRGLCRARWRRICRPCCGWRALPRPPRSRGRTRRPCSVGARLVEFGLLRSFHPLSSAQIASALHPIGALFLVIFGAPGIIAFALLHGAGNGMITIAKGTLPLALFGPRGYGLRSGVLSAPARILQSASPLLFGLALNRIGLDAVALSAGLCLAAFASLFLLRADRPAVAVLAGRWVMRSRSPTVGLQLEETASGRLQRAGRRRFWPWLS